MGVQGAPGANHPGYRLAQLVPALILGQGRGHGVKNVGGEPEYPAVDAVPSLQLLADRHNAPGFVNTDPGSLLDVARGRIEVHRQGVAAFPATFPLGQPADNLR